MARMRNLSTKHYISVFIGFCLLIIGIAGGIFLYYNGRSHKMKPIKDFVKPKELPKYFAIDIDDTFYSKDPENMKKNTEAFKLLISKGTTPFFCTGTQSLNLKYMKPLGRNYANSIKALGEEFFKETGYNGYPGVYTNGSVVYDSEGNLIKLETFSKEFMDEFKTFMYDNQLEDKTLFLSDNETYTAVQLSPKYYEMLLRNKMQDPITLSYEEIKEKKVTTIMFPSREFEIKGLRKGSDYQVKYTSKVVGQLTPGKVDKRGGLETLLENLKSNYEECAYIGDGENDKEPMERCKLSFAVANAKEDVKYHSTWVLDLTCNEGGFAKVVELMYK